MKRFEWLARIINERGYRNVAEIGVSGGRTSRHLMQACPGLCLWGVDAFRPRPGYEDMDHASNERQVRSIEKDYLGQYRAVKQESAEAAGEFPDRFFDLVFIDADHRYEGVRDDIDAWWPKVKLGGVIAGHDYNHRFPGVDRAVDEAFPRVGTADDHVWHVEPLTVACVYREGEFRSRPYRPYWTEKSRNMVARHLKAPHRFVCLSNVGVPVERVPLEHDWPGWWAKVELFRPGLFNGPTLYLDLDTLPVGDLEELFVHDGTLHAVPANPHPPREEEGRLVIPGKVNSSVMAWNGGAERIYEKFDPGVIDKLRGDQDWIRTVFPEAKGFPSEWFTKLKHCTEGPPDEVKVVLSMPWKNDAAARKFEWVNRIWT